MTAQQLKDLRHSRGWKQSDLAEILSGGLGRSFTSETVGRYERGARGIPADVDAFLTVLAASTVDDALAGGAPPPFSGAPPADDSSPAPQPGDLPPAAAPVLAIGSSYATVCEQFFELVATAVGMVGAALGSDALQRDALILDADKKALGAAYGKLAETNETFRNMIVATDKQGAYLAVALTTGTTIGKLWRNHSYTNTDLEGAALRVVPPGDDAAQPAG